MCLVQAQQDECLGVSRNINVFMATLYTVYASREMASFHVPKALVCMTPSASGIVEGSVSLLSRARKKGNSTASCSIQQRCMVALPPNEASGKLCRTCLYKPTDARLKTQMIVRNNFE